MGKATGFLDYDRKMRGWKNRWIGFAISVNSGRLFPWKNSKNREAAAWTAAFPSARMEK